MLANVNTVCVYSCSSHGRQGKCMHGGDSCYFALPSNPATCTSTDCGTVPQSVDVCVALLVHEESEFTCVVNSHTLCQLTGIVSC